MQENKATISAEEEKARQEADFYAEELAQMQDSGKQVNPNALETEAENVSEKEVQAAVKRRGPSKRCFEAEKGYIGGGKNQTVFKMRCGKFRAENGEEKSIDNTLYVTGKANKNDFMGYENKCGAYKAKFAENLNSGRLFRLRKGECELEWSLAELPKTAKGEVSSRKAAAKTVLSERGEVCGEVRYRDIAKHTMLRYRVEEDKVKEELVITAPCEKYKYSFLLKAKNLTLAKREDGEYIIASNQEEEIFVFPVPFMVDAAGNESTDVSYDLKELEDGQYILTVRADAEWMNAEERAFPVVIDPTVEITDPMISARCLHSGKGVETALRVGKSGSKYYRTYVFFSDDETLRKNVESAYLTIEFESAYNATSGVDDLFVASLLSNGTNATKFVSQSSECDIFTLSADKMSATADITKILRKWANGTIEYGISICSDESYCTKSAKITDILLTVTSNERKGKAGTQFQKNDVKRAGNSAVDLYTGRLLFEHMDVELSSNILPMSIAHEYNSDYSSEEANSAMKLGKGWRLNLQQNIAVLPSRPGFEPEVDVCLRDANGILRDIEKKRYTCEMGETPYDDPNETRWVKRYVENGAESEYKLRDGRVWSGPTEVLKDKNGVQYVFGGNDNRLTEIKNGSKSMIITYSSERIIKVTDGAGRAANFTYNSDGYLTKISYPGSKTVTFGYGDENGQNKDLLTSITDADGLVTRFEYDDDKKLNCVKDCSGYQLCYSYDDDGRVTTAYEKTMSVSISTTVTASNSADGISGDRWEIDYLTDLTTRVKNRSGVSFNYTFDVSGSLVTVYENGALGTNESQSDPNQLNIVGKASHMRTYLAHNVPDNQMSVYGYKTKYETVNVTLFNGENKTGGLENWTRKNMTSEDAVSSIAYVEDGESFCVHGDLVKEKYLERVVSMGTIEPGVYVFGCWVKASVLASVDREYGEGNGRYVGLILRYVYGTGGGERVVYAPIDPYNEGWQLVALPVYISSDNIYRVELKAICARTVGTVFFDHPYFAKADGGVTYMYDNNYSETIYRDYRLIVLYDEEMNAVRTVSVVNGGENYVTKSTYDSSNRPLTSTDWQGRKTIKTYDSYGNTLTETVQNSSGLVKMKVENTYTGGSFLTESKDEVGKTTTFEYDVNSGVMKKGTSPKGQAVSYTYDAVNSLKSVSALGNSNSLVYNKGYLVQLTHSGTVYQYTYDGFGRVKKVTADGLTILTNSYTDFGTDIDQVAGAVSKAVSQNGNGETKTVYLDKYGKTIGVRQGNGALSQEMYDVNNNLIQHIDNDNGIQYNYTYNADGDLKEYTEEQDNEERVKHVIEYDGMDRVEGETYTIGSKTMAYGYEYVEYPEEDVTEITAPFGRVEYTKDTLGRLTKKVVRTGCNKELVTQYTYKASDRSGYTTPYVSVQTVNPGGTTYRYEYDANGNITKISTRGGSELASFEYDGLNRLTRENISGQKTVTYMYNAAGNLTEKLVYPYTASGTGLSSGNIQENIAYTYESTWSDRLKSYNGQSVSYDSAGNPTSYMGKTVTWSHGRMTGYGTTTYGYNDAGIRIRKGTTEYYVEGTRILAEKRNGTMLYYYYDESGVTAFEYGGQMYYYQKNLQGDVIGICDNCGNVLGTYRYDAWGKILSQGTNNILAVNPFRYRGYYYDTETELYYLQTRYYDPETGRFLSADDISYLDPETINGLNQFAYCYSNPINISLGNDGIVDPSIIGRDGDGLGSQSARSVPDWLKTGIGAIPDIILGIKYLLAKGIHNKFVYSTNTLYMFPELGANWSRFKIAKNGYGKLVGASFKKIITGNARAGWGAVIKSFGKTAALTGIINFGFNLYENNWQIDGAMLLDTAIDAGIGLASYGLAALTASFVVAGVAMAGIAIPGVVVVGGIILLSIGFEWLIREITGYKN